MGKPKLFLDFRGNTFIAHLLLQLQTQVNDVMIAGAPDPQQLADLGIPVLVDRAPDLGPLGGIATALQHARRQWLLIAPCDNPLLPANYAVRMLHTARERDLRLLYVRKQGREQPMYALLRCDLRDSLEQYLASGERKVMPWYTSVGAEALEWNDAYGSFENLNTPEAYEQFIQSFQFS